MFLDVASDEARTKLHKEALEKSNMVVKLYVEENDYPVVISYPDVPKYFELHPTPKEYQSVNNFFWLAFCVNGNIGPASAKFLNEYWTQKARATDFWRKSGNRGIPDAQICSSLYAEKSNALNE